jgi:hypothetical protein
MIIWRTAILVVTVSLAVTGCSGGAGPTVGPSVPTTSATASPVATSSIVAGLTPGPTVAAPRRTVDPNYSGIETMAFGLRVTNCHLDRIASTFATTDPVVASARYRPSLIAGTIVTIDVTRDGVELSEYPQTVVFDTPGDCISGNVSQHVLKPGHYRMEIVPDTAPPISSEFDVK